MSTSVRAKLAAGFGAVLMLTAALTWSALYNLHKLAARSQSLVDSISLDGQIAKIRFQENEFDRASREGAVDGFDKEIKIFNNIIEDVLTGSEDDAQESIERIKTVGSNYQNSFNDFVVARRHAIDVKAAMTPVVEKIRSRLDQVSTGLFGVLQSNPAQIGLALESAFKLQALTSMLQGQVDDYLLNPSEQAREVLSVTADNIRKQGNDLWVQLPSESSQQLLVEGLGAVLVYQDQIEEFRKDIESGREAKQAMLKQASELQALGQKLYMQHVQGRDADIRGAQWGLLIAAALALFLGLAASILITRQITPSLTRALHLARQIASGDMTGELKVTSHDEIGQMMGAMQDMTRQLRQLIGRIGKGAEQLRSAAQRLETTTTQSSEGANHQQQQISLVATSISELVASAQHVAQNAKETSQATQVTEQRTAEGDEVIAQALVHFDLLLANVAQGSAAMARLGKDSERIDGVLRVIRDVADQTNLLALNAAIEAARAGESGRGFAVVADEVRNLARRTQQSTQEIETLIASLQNGAEQATNLMNQSEKLSSSSVALARNAGKILGDIRSSVASIHHMSLNIATAADQQTEVSNRISRNLQQVRDVADEAAVNGLETTDASSELSRLSTELASLIQHFKVA